MIINLKTAIQGTITHKIADIHTLTVSEFKSQISSKCGLQPDQMRLVTSNGKVLQPDTADLVVFELQENDTIYVTRQLAQQGNMSSSGSSPSNIANLSKNPGSAIFPPEMASLMNNPLISSLLSNPEYLKHMLQSHPQIKRMVESNPEIRQMIESPSFLRQMSETMRNPEMMKEMLRNQDRQLSNIESIPGGFNYLSSMYQSLQDPLNNTDDSDGRPKVINENTPAEASRTLNTEALPNPWASNNNNDNNTTRSTNPMPAMNHASNGSMSNPFGLPLLNIQEMFNAFPAPGQQPRQNPNNESSLPSPARNNGTESNLSSQAPWNPALFGPPTTSTPQNTPLSPNLPFSIPGLDYFEHTETRNRNGQLGNPSTGDNTTNSDTTGLDSSSPNSSNLGNSFIFHAPGFDPERVNNMFEEARRAREMIERFEQMRQVSALPASMAPSSEITSSINNVPSTNRNQNTASTTLNVANNKAQPPNEVKFERQLNELKDMGFNDRERCIRALLASGGDVEGAVQYILDTM